MAAIDPHGLPDDAERVSPVAPIAHWSENFCCTGWDEARGIGLWLHMGRSPYDPELWHEMLSLHLPDGRVLITKNFSTSRSAQHAHGELLELRCVRPWTAWEVRFAGPLKATTQQALRTAPMADGRERQVELALAWTSDQPPWHFGGAGEWATGHYQQLGRYAGTLRIDGIETPLQMEGWRDHSVGPRDLGPVAHSNLLAASFEDGSSLYAYQRVVAGREPTGAARVGRGTSFADVAPVDLPAVDDARGPSDTYTFPMRGADGAIADVDVELLCQLPVTMFAPNDMVLGLADDPGGYVLWMGQGRFRRDGVVGYGYVGRSGRV